MRLPLLPAVALRPGALYFVIFIQFAAQGRFLSLFFKERGLSDSQIGSCMALQVREEREEREEKEQREEDRPYCVLCAVCCVLCTLYGTRVQSCRWYTRCSLLSACCVSCVLKQVYRS